MGFYEIILIALGLAMDCFAVSLGVCTTTAKKTPRSIFRLAFHFGLFQGGMAFLGWLAGSRIVNLISSFDHWIAFALLLWVGGRMVKESFDKDDCEGTEDPTRGRSLVILSIATSIDALAVGLSLAFVDGSILTSSLSIGAVSFLLSIAGSLLGTRMGSRFGKRMELLGGILLIGIGLRVLISQLF